MARDFRDFVNEVSTRANIIRVISDYVKLKKQGSRYFGLCPFHQEKTPSFSVNAEKNLYYCFGCGAGGNLFTFLQQIEGLTFSEAVKEAAKRSGIPVPVFKSEGRKQPKIYDLLYEVNDVAASWFFNKLINNHTAYKYLTDRGIKEETIQKYRLGYAPDSWEGLLEHLKKSKYDEALLKKTGLFITTKNNELRDMFRGRIMFPIHDYRGRICGFGGRLLKEGNVKYLNSPETPIFSKSRHLFGLFHAAKSIRKQNYAILVEGYFDQIILSQSGFENAVAPLGTAFNRNGTDLLRRYTDRVVIAFDADDAGQKAAQRALDPLLASGFEVKFLSLPAGMDPDDFITKNGIDKMKERLSNTRDMLDYLISAVASNKDMGTPRQKSKAIKTILQHLSYIDDATEREIYIRKMADILNISVETLLQKNYRRRPAYRKADEQIEGKQAANLPPLDEQKLIRIVAEKGLLFREQIKELLEEKTVTKFTEVVLHTAESIVKSESEKINLTMRITEQIQDEEQKSLFAQIMIENQEYKDAPERELLECINSIQKRHLIRQRDALKLNLKKASESEVASDTEIEEILKKIQDLACQIENLA